MTLPGSFGALVAGVTRPMRGLSRFHLVLSWAVLATLTRRLRGEPPSSLAEVSTSVEQAKYTSGSRTGAVQNDRSPSTTRGSSALTRAFRVGAAGIEPAASAV